MKTKTSELTGAALDWAVWVAAGGAAAYPKTASGPAFLKLWKGNTAKYVHPSTDWAQGGPIIEQEGIGLMPSGTAYFERNGGTFYSYGSTPLVAAMRCFCVSRLGDEINIPEELL